MGFRYDINGLRAIAIIAVVLYHFNEPWMPGGFAGVDVFFVISGFLMTGIIFRGLEANNFSIIKFYIDRGNRIIPPLAALCFSLLIFGWFYLTPLDYKELGKHVGSSIGFLSNIVYLRESGYFDASSYEKWLLHTWSLSAEWQFYIIYPLVIVTLQKFIPLGKIKTILFAVTVVSFIFCIFSTYNWPDASYYLLPARAWEMMLGGIAYLYPIDIKNKRTKNAIEAFGLILIIGSYMIFSKENKWPSHLALLPVLGTYLVIQAKNNESIFTNNYVFQKIGTWSYSIYLWHWPLVVGIYYFSMDRAFIYVGIIASILLGFISNKFIESVKFTSSNDWVTLIRSKPVHLLLFIGILASYIFIENGVDDRFILDQSLVEIKKELKMPLRGNGYCFYSFNDSNFAIDKDIGTNCYLGDKTKKSDTLMFGDSYAGHNEPFFDLIFKDKNSSFQSITTNSCLPSITTNYTGPKTNPAYQQCLLNREYLKENIGNYKNIILAGSWGSAIEQGQLNDTIELLNLAVKIDVDIFIIAAPYRYLKSPLHEWYKSLYFNNEFKIKSVPSNDSSSFEANNVLKKYASTHDNIHFIGRESLFEIDNVFYIKNLAIPYHLDNGHISILGSKYSAKYFMKQSNYQNMISKFKI